MPRLSPFHSTAALLCLTVARLAAQDPDSVEVTPHNVTRPVTQNTGTGVGACQQFLPWAYDANGTRVRQQQTFVWSVSNPADFEVDTAGGNACARLIQLSGTVTTMVTATIVGTRTSGTATFTVTPDPAMAPVAAAPPAPPPNPAEAEGTPTAAHPEAGGGVLMDTTLRPPGPPPTNVTVTAVSPTALRISWGGVAGASAYYVYRSSSAGGSFTALTTAPVQGNLTNDPTLMPNTTAYYKVSALVPNQGEGMSAAVSGTTFPAPNPASLTAILSGDQKSVALTWPAPTGASGYQLYKGGGLVSTTPLRTTSYKGYRARGRDDPWLMRVQRNPAVKYVLLTDRPNSFGWFVGEDHVSVEMEAGARLNLGPDEMEIGLISEVDWAKEVVAWNICKGTRSATLHQPQKSAARTSMRVRRGIDHESLGWHGSRN
ncbi:MAG: hypothetical protein ACREMX_13045 [Gemmatimonadales bacterium]